MNSDKEELDYEDDLMDAEDGDSMSQDFHDQEDLSDKDLRVVEPAEAESNNQQRQNVPVCAVGASETSNGLALGTTSTSMLDEEMVMNNLHLKRLLNKMLDERIQQTHKSGETSSSQILTKMTPTDQSKSTSNQGRSNIIKSPSDTTIYVPVLNKARANFMQTGSISDRAHGIAMNNAVTGLCNNVKRVDILKTSEHEMEMVEGGVTKPIQNVNAVTHISNFVEQMRMEQEQCE